MAARFLPVQHPDSLASRPVWGDSSTPSRHACMGRGCDSSFCCRLGHRHSHASARDGIRKRSSESQGATGIALPLKAAQVLKRSFAASHPGHGTGCYRSAAITPRSASQDRYAVHSCQSTSSDRRRPFVSTGLGHPKALVGKYLPVTDVGFRGAHRGLMNRGTRREDGSYACFGRKADWAAAGSASESEAIRSASGLRSSVATPGGSQPTRPLP